MGVCQRARVHRLEAVFWPVERARLEVGRGGDGVKRGKSKSELEARFVQAWLQFAPPGTQLERDYRFHPTRRWEFDFCHVPSRVAIEIDGGQWAPHGGRHNRDSDREKLNAAAEMGWRVLRYSGAMLDEPERVVAQVARALGA